MDLVPRGDYRAASLFVDGHHMSRLGAARLSEDVGALLAPYLKQLARRAHDRS